MLVGCRMRTTKWGVNCRMPGNRLSVSPDQLAVVVSRLPEVGNVFHPDITAFVEQVGPHSMSEGLRRHIHNLLLFRYR